MDFFFLSLKQNLWMDENEAQTAARVCVSIQYIRPLCLTKS